MEVCITNFGGRIASIMVPDKAGNMQDVVLGFDSIQDYINVPNNFGAAIGRYANRIGQAKFTLDSVEYKLPANNFGHCLHGGPKGFHNVVFDAKLIDDQTLELTYLAKDGEEGFPGNLSCKVTYKLTDDNAIDIKYEATTDKPTIVNMTNHSYFNLNGDPKQTILDNLLTINADSYTPVDSTFMTSGEIVTVKGTDMDFLTPNAIGSRINNYSFVQLKNGNGYDHNWVLNTKGDIKQVAATVESPVTGIVLNVYTNEPGIQVYTGNFLDGTVKGKKGIVYNQRAAICLETQKYPDTPNKPQWPSAVLRPGETYKSECIFAFSVKK
jgi:aldose 1-epimerase